MRSLLEHGATYGVQRQDSAGARVKVSWVARAALLEWKRQKQALGPLKAVAAKYGLSMSAAGKIVYPKRETPSPKEPTP